MAEGRTSRYYKNGTTKKGGKAKPKKAAASRKKHQASSAKAQKKSSAVKKRVEANKFNRNDPRRKKNDKTDASHKNGRVVRESQKANRARGGGKKK